MTAVERLEEWAAARPGRSVTMTGMTGDWLVSLQFSARDEQLVGRRSVSASDSELRNAVYEAVSEAERLTGEAEVYAKAGDS